MTKTVPLHPHLGPPSIESPPEPKSPKENTSIWRSFVGTCLHAATYVGKTGFDPVAADKISRKKLHQNTKDHNLANSIELFYLRSEDGIEENIETFVSESYPLNRSAIKREKELIHTCLRSTLLRMFANLSDDTARAHPDSEKIDLLMMTSHLSEVLKFHIDLLEIEHDPDLSPEEQLKQEEQRMAALTEDLIHRLLPNGKNDIIVPPAFGFLVGIFYGYIKQSIAKQVQNYYHTVCDPISPAEKEKLELMKLNGGKVFVGITDALVSNLPAILDQNARSLVEEHAGTLFPEEDKGKLLRWVESNIHELSTSDDPNIQNIWIFIEHYFGNLLNHTLMKAAQNASSEDKNENALDTVTQKCLGIIQNFFFKHEEEIEKSFLLKNPATRFLIFEPLCDELLAFFGFDDQSTLPIPEGLRDPLRQSLYNFTPGFFADLYRDMMLPFQESPQDLHRTWKTKGVSEANHVVHEQTNKILSSVRERLTTDADQLAAQAIAKINENTQEVKLDKTDEAWVSDFLRNTLTTGPAGDLLENGQLYVDRMLIKMLTNLACTHPLQDEEMNPELLTNAILHVIRIANDRMPDKILRRLREYAHTEEKKKPKIEEKLIRELQPLSAELLAKAGFPTEESLPVPSFLRKNIIEQQIPKFILGIISGLTVDDRDLTRLQLDLGKDAFFPIEETAKTIAKQLIPTLQGQLPNIVNGITSDKDMSDWLSQQLQPVSKSRQAKPMWNFVDTFVSNAITKVLGHAALAYPNKEVDAHTGAMMQLFKMVVHHIQGKEPSKITKESFQPMAVEILETIGYGKPENLPLPFFLQEALWNQLSNEIIPTMMMDTILPLQVKDEWKALPGAEHLDAFNGLLAQKVLNSVRETEFSDAIAERLKTFIPNKKARKELANALSGQNNYGQAMMKRTLQHLLNRLTFAVASESPSDSPHLFPKAIEGILEIGDKHFKENKVNLMVLLYATETGNEEMRKKGLADAFEPLVEDLLKLTGIGEEEELPVPHWARESVMKALKEDLLPEICLEVFQLYYAPECAQSNFKSNFRELTDKNLPLQHMMDSITPEITKEVRAYLSKNPDTVHEFLMGSLELGEIDPELTAWIKQGVQMTTDNQSPIAEKTWKYAEEIMKATVLHSFMSVSLEHAPAIRFTSENLPAYLIGNLFKFPKELEIEMLAAADIEDVMEREKKLDEIFPKIAEHMMDCFGPDPFIALPLPNALKEKILNAIKSEVLPNYIKSLYRDFTEHQILPEDKSDLAVTARVLGSYVRDLTASKFAQDFKELSDQWVESVVSVLKTHPQGRVIGRYIQENPDAVKAILASNIEELGNELNGQNINVLQLFGKVVEGYTHRIMKGMLDNLEKIEKKNNHFILESSKKLMNLAKDHLVAINHIASKHRKPIYEVDPLQLHAGLKKEGVLHPALHVSPMAKQEERDEQMQKLFFKPMTEKLIKLANLQEGSEISKTHPELLSLIQEHGGTILKQIFDAVSSRPMMEKIFNATLETLMEEGEELPRANLKRDKDFEKLCSSFVDEMLQTVPGTIGKLLIHEVDPLRSKIGELMADAIQQNFKRENWSSYILKGIVSGIPQFDPHVRSDGQHLFLDDTSYTHEILTKEEELQVQKMNRKKLHKNFIKYLRYQTNSILKVLFGETLIEKVHIQAQDNIKRLWAKKRAPARIAAFSLGAVDFIFLRGPKWLVSAARWIVSKIATSIVLHPHFSASSKRGMRILEQEEFIRNLMMCEMESMMDQLIQEMEMQQAA